ncbi:MAG: hypothetical protein IK143_04550 [Bacteroidales bacterium]|nr:hypothetical protein [Bacteroidales bacterium]
MKKIFALICIAVMAALSSCVRKGDLDLEPVPDIAFEYTCEGLTLTFNSVIPNTTDIKWEVVGLTQATGDTFTYAFPEPGTYWIKMTGNYNGSEQTVAGKILVAKPSPVRLDDDSFDDWDAVTYPDFQLVGDDGISYGKFDYNADYIFFFVAMNTTIPGCTAEGAIMNIRMDSDDLTGTGMSTKGLGCDWYLEGSFWWPDGWANWYDCASGDTEYVEGMPIETGTYRDEGDMVYFEFALSRKKYGINGSSVGIFFKFYTEDWEDAIYMTCGDKTTYHFALDKSE